MRVFTPAEWVEHLLARRIWELIRQPWGVGTGDPRDCGEAGSRVPDIRGTGRVDLGSESAFRRDAPPAPPWWHGHTADFIFVDEAPRAWTSAAHPPAEDDDGVGITWVDIGPDLTEFRRAIED